jgi:leucyl-tRNA synthetase
MEIKYNPAEIEEKWQKRWERSRSSRSRGSRQEEYYLH